MTAHIIYLDTFNDRRASPLGDRVALPRGGASFDDYVVESHGLARLRGASIRMGDALERLRDVVETLGVDEIGQAGQASRLAYLADTLCDQMVDLNRETEGFLSVVRR